MPDEYLDEYVESPNNKHALLFPGLGMRQVVDNYDRECYECEKCGFEIGYEVLDAALEQDRYAELAVYATAHKEMCPQ